MADQLKFTILGCSSSPGVPRVDGDWGACDPKNPKNRRLRCSLLAQRISGEGTTTVIIDTGPDFREQILSTGTKWLNAVLYTHSHADHVHGIDDLRGFALVQRARVDVYADAENFGRIREGFNYCFKSPKGSMYPPILEPHMLEAFEPIKINGQGGTITVTPVPQVHGRITSYGFRFDCGKNGDFCYSSDVSDLDADSVKFMQNLDCWVVDALQYKPHISHFSLNEALEWIERLKPSRAILTHMHIPMDYDIVANETPDHVSPAYDGLTLTYELDE